MIKLRSYIKIADLPLDRLNGLTLPVILDVTRYGPISEKQKEDVIVLKEAFVLLDPKARRVGVVTRSDKDHGTKIGQCSTLLCGNFKKNECTLTQDGMIIYDVKARLHNYMKEISGLFIESQKRSIPTIFFHDKERNKRYIFLIFELTCDSRDVPLCCRLDNREEDMFIGMRDLCDVQRGVEKYNYTQFEVDKSVVRMLSPKERRPLFSGKWSITDKIVEAKLANFTLIKFNLFGT
ncbi:MAG: hypothetical protein PHH44_01460 [bacterium]|nr:hypothetical protein [bacterium]